MNVAGVYELLKIPYTGAGPLALGTALNKPRVKEILLVPRNPHAAVPGVPCGGEDRSQRKTCGFP